LFVLLVGVVAVVEEVTGELRGRVALEEC